MFFGVTRGDLITVCAGAPFELMKILIKRWSREQWRTSCYTLLVCYAVVVAALFIVGERYAQELRREVHAAHTNVSTNFSVECFCDGE